METGIYEIVNTLNGKRYVGSAVNFANRWRLHRGTLRNGDHRSRTLQRAWNKYGEEAFQFHPLLVCVTKNLLFYEQRCIDGFAPEYNMCKVAGSRLGTKYTDEARARLAILRKAQPRSEKQLQHIANLAEAARGKPGRRHSDEVRAKISASLTGKKQSAELILKRTAHQLGTPRSAETKAKISAAHVGRKKSPAVVEKVRLANTGKKRSDEVRAKLSAAMKARIFTPQHRARIAATKALNKEKRRFLPGD